MSFAATEKGARTRACSRFGFSRIKLFKARMSDKARCRSRARSANGNRTSSEGASRAIFPSRKASLPPSRVPARDPGTDRLEWAAGVCLRAEDRCPLAAPKVDVHQRHGLERAFKQIFHPAVARCVVQLRVALHDGCRCCHVVQAVGQGVERPTVGCKIGRAAEDVGMRRQGCPPNNGSIKGHRDAQLGGIVDNPERGSVGLLLGSVEGIGRRDRSLQSCGPEPSGIVCKKCIRRRHQRKESAVDGHAGSGDCGGPSISPRGGVKRMRIDLDIDLAVPRRRAGGRLGRGPDHLDLAEVDLPTPAV